MEPWTFEFDGFVFSTTNGSCVSEITGLDLPEMRTNDVDIPGQHGAIAGLDRLSGRTFDVTTDLIAASDNDLLTLAHELSLATGPRDTEVPFRFRLSDNQPVMRIECRPRRRNIPITNRHVFGFVPVALQFYAPDPLVYSDTLNSGFTNAASTAGGRGFDWVFDWTYEVAGGESGEVDAPNAGTAPANWIAQINGPCLNPTLGATGGFIRWEGTLNAGEFLEINSYAGQRTVLLGGTSTRYEQLTLDSTWFELQPGANTVRFATEDGNGSMNFTWRDAWYSAT